MRTSAINSLDQSIWFSVLSPIKRVKKIKTNPVIIGFDTEFIPDDLPVLCTKDATHLRLPPRSGDGSGKQRLVSVQLANDKLSRVYLVDRKPLVTLSELWELVLSFLSESGVETIPDNPVYLVAHFAQAEIAGIEDSDRISLTPANKALSGVTRDGGLPLVFVDLYGILSVSLRAIGDYLGLEKISLDGVGGKPELYWKQNIDELLRLMPTEFNRYASRDAEICYRAYTQIREFFLNKYGLDILNYKTLPSISGDIFRSTLTRPVAPVRIEESSRSYRLRSGEYSRTVQKTQVYSGSLDTRYSALRAYHGGRVESFYRGRIVNADLAYYDIVSLYPSAALLSPLPNAETRWFRVECGTKEEESSVSTSGRKSEITSADGFIEVEFRFPANTQYPCLPVDGVRDDLVYFPLDGVSYCTLSELRLAIKLGLKDYWVLSGYAFIPGPSEREHPAKPFFTELLSLKKGASPGSVEYLLFKGLVNSLVGKLVQRNATNPSLGLVQAGVIERDRYSQAERRVGKGTTVGSLWSPEWASLITGKARAIIGEFVSMGAYLVSTDSVLLPSSTDISCDSLTRLRSVGSDLKQEFLVDHAVLIRSRLYALNPLSEDIKQRRAAHAGASCSDEDFLRMVREGYKSRCIPNLNYINDKQLVRYEEAIRTGLPLNSPKHYEGTVNLKWDGKRILDIPVDTSVSGFRGESPENPFDGLTPTKPLDSSVLRNNPMRRTKELRKGRPSGRGKQDRIIELYGLGGSPDEIGRELGVSKQWVYRVISSLKKNDISISRIDRVSANILDISIPGINPGNASICMVEGLSLKGESQGG